MPLILLQGLSPLASLAYLFAVFAVSWAAFFVYVFFVTRRQEEMRRQIRELRQALEEQVAGDRDHSG